MMESQFMHLVLFFPNKSQMNCIIQLALHQHMRYNDDAMEA